MSAVSHGVDRVEAYRLSNLFCSMVVFITVASYDLSCRMHGKVVSGLSWHEFAEQVT